MPPPQSVLQQAMSLHVAGNFPQAEALYRQILADDPRHAEALHLLGVIAAQTGHLDEAVQLITQAIAIKPNFPRALGNLGNALRDKGQLDEAIIAYRKAIEINPKSADSHRNLANALRDKGQLEEAIAPYQQALAINPTLVAAHAYLGNVLRDLGKVAPAIACFQQALALDPTLIRVRDALLTTLVFDPSCDSHSLLVESQRWNCQHAQPLAGEIQAHSNNRDPERRLRIGYVASDFRCHVSAFFLLPLFRHIDRRQFDVICYAQVARPDIFTQQMRDCVSDWRWTVGSTDAEIASIVRQDRIDILVDLNLHGADNRLLVFAQKPAPVQVTWLGYPGTTGLDTIDYRLTDPYLDPPGFDESCYTERSVRLADTFWCYHPLSVEPHINDLPCLQKIFVTFGCLNNFLKINDDVLALWARVLKAVPNSRLMMLTPDGNARRPLLDRLVSEGVDSARVDCVSRKIRGEYLYTYHRIDIALDTFPYNGHTTSLDALWMGVPVVTLVGKTVVGRAGFSQLSNLGLTELIAHTPDQFVQIAADLAGDRSRLAQLRATLRQRMESSPLMDAGRFARNIESAYRTMWRTWCGGGGI